MTSSTLARSIWIMAAFALVLGFARDALPALMPRPRELPRLDGATGRPWVDDAFIRAGDYQEIARGLLPPHIPAVSSWLGSDEAKARTETAWFKANRWIVHVGVAGYPQHAGCKLWAEFRAADGAITRLDCPLANPREQWSVWEIRRPAKAVAVRICAEDFATDNAGWVAFSHPFRAWPGVVTASYQALQLAATTALTLTLLWGPGLLWIARRETWPAPVRLVCFLGAGPLALAAAGGAIWLSSGTVPPQIAGAALVAAGWLAIGLAACRRGFALPESAWLRRVLAVTALVIVAVVAKSGYSTGPEGELFRGTVSRNFEMNDRIDSRYSFYVVQVAAQHLAPSAPASERFFAPWTFFSRGPLAGLASLPVVMATNGRPPIEVPENRWSPYDATGFAAYRITMIALSSSVIVSLFFLLAPLAGERWAAIAAGLLALCPFGVHELMFTWPKWPATAWLIAAFALAHARRPLAAGLALAVGFLFHPLVLLWGPWLALWCAGRSERRPRAIAGALLRFGGGAAILVAPWIVIGAVAPHLPSTPVPGQAGFFRYWARADWQIATWDTWWRTRWMNFANTFVPLHGYLSEASFNHPKLGSAYEASGRLVKFSQLWWNSLPFGTGLSLWFIGMAVLARTTRTLLAPTLLFVAAPALFITAYWGMDPLGLMRECGHPILVAFIAIMCVTGARSGGWLRRILAHRAVPWLQLPETWLMLWLTTLANPRPWAADYQHLDAVYLTINVAALLLAAHLLSTVAAIDITSESKPSTSPAHGGPLATA